MIREPQMKSAGLFFLLALVIVVPCATIAQIFASLVLGR